MSGAGRSDGSPGRGVSDCRDPDISAARNRGLPGRNTVLEIDPVARRHAEQIGCTPNDVILELADLPVGINHLPHHLDDAESALFIYPNHYDAGEVTEFDRLALNQHRGRAQLIRVARIEPEAHVD